MPKIDTEYTQNAICPHCGCEQLDSWELESGEYDCEFCNKPFIVIVNVEISYLTYKAKLEILKSEKL